MRVVTEASRGMAFVHWAVSLVVAKGDPLQAGKIMEARHPYSAQQIRAAVAAGTTSDAVWAAPLAALQSVASEFVALARPASIIGRLPGVRSVPFQTKIPRTANSGTSSWIGEGRPVPVGQMAFDSISLPPSKVGSICVLTDELVRLSSPEAEGVVRTEMVAAAAEMVDRAFIDPSLAAVPFFNPASVLNGAPSVPSTGTTQAAILADLGAAMALHTVSESSRWVMRPGSWSWMVSQRVNDPWGPSIFGIGVVTSRNIPSNGNSPAGYPVSLIDASEIFVADDGAEVDGSREAVLEMSDSPTYPVVGSTNVLSLFQTDLLGLKLTRFVGWLKRRADAAVYVSGFPKG